MLRRLFHTLRLPIRKNPVRVAFSIMEYPNNNTAIEVLKPTLLGYKDWDTLTVNTGAVFPKDIVCIDTNHHGENIIMHLEKANLGSAMGTSLVREFCRYPIFHLNLDEIKKYCVKDNARIYY